MGLEMLDAECDSAVSSIDINGWDQTTTVINLFDVKTGTTPSTKNSDYWENGDIVWITPNDLSKNNGKIYIKNSERKVTRSALENSNLNLLPENSIILSTRAPVGYVSLNSRAATINQGCKGLVPKDSEQTKTEFYYYYLKLIKPILERFSGGSTFKELSKKALEEIVLPIPHPTEQRKIAVVLSSVDAVIENTVAIIDTFKDIRRDLLRDLLIHGIDENGAHRDPVAHPEQFGNSPVGMVPITWTVRPIGSACALIRDGTHLPPKRVEDGPLLLSVRNLINGKLQLTNSDTRISWDFYKMMHQKWEIQFGDVLLAIVGATIGKTAIVPQMLPFTVQRSVAVLRGRSEVLNNKFLNFWLSGPYFQTHLWDKVNQTAQPGIYLGELSSFYIPLPSLDEQEAIVSILDVNNGQIQLEESYLNWLKLLKRGLMQDLLTGKVRVKVDGHA